MKQDASRTRIIALSSLPLSRNIKLKVSPEDWNATSYPLQVDERGIYPTTWFLIPEDPKNQNVLSSMPQESFKKGH